MNPTFYVIRTSHSNWVLTPFHEDVVVNQHHDRGPYRDTEILDGIRNDDVSLMMDDSGGEVEWMHGCDVNIARLHAMKVHERY